MLHAVSAIPSMPTPPHVPMDKGRASTFRKTPHRTWDMGQYPNPRTKQTINHKSTERINE